MGINKINSESNWGKAAADLNNNFDTLNADILKIKDATTRNKGYFATAEDLFAALPSAKVGDVAFVGAEYPYAVYRWDGIGWANNGEVGGESVDLHEYPTKDELSAELSAQEERINEETDIKISGLVVQETGDGEGVVMSQKAVTEKIGEVGKEVDGVSLYLIKEYTAIEKEGYANNWQYPVTLQPGKKYYVKHISGDINNFFTGDGADRILLTKGEWIEFTAIAGGFPETYMSNRVNRPVVSIVDSEGLFTILNKINSELDNNSNRIKEIGSYVGDGIIFELGYNPNEKKYLTNSGVMTDATYKTNYVTDLIEASPCKITCSVATATETDRISVAFYNENGNLLTGEGFISGYNIATESGNYRLSDYNIYPPTNAKYMAFAWVYSPDNENFKTNLSIKKVNAISELLVGIKSVIGHAEIPAVSTDYKRIIGKYLPLNGIETDIQWGTNFVSDYIDSSECFVSGCFASNTDRYSVAFYDENKRYVGGINIALNTGRNKNINYHVVPVSGARYMRFAWVYSPDNEDFNLDLSIDRKPSLSSLAKENSCVYVSPNGNDQNDGSRTAPFATFQRAIDLGYTNIIGEPGVYKGQRIEVSNIKNLAIRVAESDLMKRYSSTHKRRGRIVFDNSIDVDNLESYGTIYRTELSVPSTHTYHKVFISKELQIEPIKGLQSTSWYAILWEMDDELSECVKLTPVEDIAKCQETKGSFTYDGSYLYINPSNGIKSYKRLNIDDYQYYGFKISQADGLHIEDVDVMFYPHGNCWWIDCINSKVANCDFGFAATWSGNEIHSSNIDFIHCIAYKNAADGFAPGISGVANFYNCQGYYNYDDGVSHHDGSEGCIDGGYWAFNRKGGIAPAYGSKVNVKNVISINNGYGCYFVGNDSRKTDELQVMTGCTFANNSVADIRIDHYNILCTRTTYSTKKFDSGSFTEIDNNVLD